MTRFLSLALAATLLAVAVCAGLAASNQLQSLGPARPTAVHSRRR